MAASEKYPAIPPRAEREAAERKAISASPLASAATSFGALISNVGNAVATTQERLANTSAATAEALAKTLVDVVAVRSVTYDDDGNRRASASYVRRLPLIDFVDPVFYQWTQVRLQGQFYISQFGASTTSDSQTISSVGSSRDIAAIFLFGGNQSNTSVTEQSTSTGMQVEAQQAFGAARMFARLNPRTDTGVPRPTRSTQGPSLQIIQGVVKDLPAAGATPLTGRSMALQVQLRRIDGTPIADKAISIETDGVPWSFTAGGRTDAAGNLAILLERGFPPAAVAGVGPDTRPVSVVVTARLGLVSNAVTVAL